MKQDLSKNYNFKKWLLSLGVKKNIIIATFVIPIIIGTFYLTVDWVNSKFERRIVLKQASALDDSYYMNSNHSVMNSRQKRQIYCIHKKSSQFISIFYKRIYFGIHNYEHNYNIYFMENYRRI